MNSNFFFMKISVTLQVIDLKFSVCSHTILPERSASHNFDLGPSFHFMAKNG